MIQSALHSFGLNITSVTVDGNIHRCARGDSKKKNAWYVAFGGERITCVYGDWASDEKYTITEGGAATYDPERIKIWRKIAEAKKAEEAKIHVEAAEYATKMARVWEKASPDHPYLIKKGIMPGAALMVKGRLIILLHRPNGDIVGYQEIDAEGGKKFLFGTVKKGACHVIEGNGSMVIICEGWATGMSLHQATGYTVLVCFDAGNMIHVARASSTPGSLVIGADNDDKKGGVNVGLEKAKEIHNELGIPYLYPTGIKGTDFNDLHQEQGLDAVAEIIMRGYTLEIYQKENVEPMPTEILYPPGMLGKIADYYMSIAIKPNPLFGLACGLIVGSVLFGRRYHTEHFNNYTSLYLAIAAMSGGGKDCVKSVVRELLASAGLGWLERGGGYTAANTVIRSLQAQPLQIAFFEEFGQRLREAASNKSNAQGVFRILLDVWSSCHSTSKGEEYADGSIPSVDNPALTMVGMTTPDALFSSISAEMIEQGFVNRILPFINLEGRRSIPLRIGNGNGPPVEVTDWMRSKWPERGNLTDVTNSSPGVEFRVKVPWEEPGAVTRLNEIEDLITKEAINLDRRKLGDMLTREREQTMRVSLILAGMSDHPCVTTADVNWAWVVVSYLYRVGVDQVRRHSFGSEFEKAKLEALQALREAGEKGVAPRAMPKTPPWAKMDKKLRGEVLTELQDAKLADIAKVRTGARGPATTVWVALR